MIKLINVSKKFQDQLVLKDINLSITNCGFYVLKGESGCGKTTLLNIIAKSESVSSGLVETKGKIATIYQNYDLIDELTVKENICFLNNTDDSFDFIVNKLNIANLLNHYPCELSGGQKQRVGIARAIYFNPDIILCDEPTEALDFENKLIVLDFLKELSKNKIVIVVTHDVELVNYYADITYNIGDKKLSVINGKELNKPLTYNAKSLVVDSEKIINKINKKSNIKSVLAITIAVLIFISLFIWTANTFKINDSNKVLNIDKVYIRGKEIDKRLKNKLKDVIGIVEFKNAIINDKDVDVNVFPIVDNNNFQYITPKANEVIINQNLKELLNIGDFLKLKYLGVRGLDIKEFKVVDIINEDTNVSNIYYNLDVINDTFNHENELLETDFSTYIYKNSPLKQATLSYSELGDIYEISIDIKNNDIFNPTYDERLKTENRLSIYKMFSVLFETIYILTILIFIVLYNYKDSKRKLKSYALLLGFNEDKQHIILLHRKNKIYYYFIFSLLIIPIMFILTYINKDILQFMDILILVIIYLLITIAYFISINLNLVKLDKTNIHSILKEE